MTHEEKVYKRVKIQKRQIHNMCHNNAAQSGSNSYMRGARACADNMRQASLCQQGQHANYKTPHYFCEVAQKWLKAVNLKCKLSTYNKYRNIYEKNVEKEFGHYRISEISGEAIDDYIYKLQTVKNKAGKIFSSKTIQDICMVIKQIFQYARENYNMCPQFSIKKLSVKQCAKETPVIAPHTIQILCQYLLFKPDLYKVGVLISLYTGIRIGELCALQWKDISFADGVIHVSKTAQRLQQLDNPEKKTKLCITPPKSTCSNRVIPLPESLLALLFQIKSNDDFYIISGSNKCIDPRTMQYHFKKYLKDCAIEETNFHVLRHTFATHCIELGFDAKTLSEILGHSSVNITLNRYVHSSMKIKHELMNKLVIGE